MARWDGDGAARGSRKQIVGRRREWDGSSVAGTSDGAAGMDDGAVEGGLRGCRLRSCHTEDEEGGR